MLGQALSSTVQNNETNCELGMSKNLIPVTVNKKPTLAILDTGAAVSCISVQFAQKLKLSIQKNSTADHLFTANGRCLKTLGNAMVEVGIQNFRFYQLFYIVSSLNHTVLLGLDFLKRTSCRLDLWTDSVSFLANSVFATTYFETTNGAVAFNREFIYSIENSNNNFS